MYLYCIYGHDFQITLTHEVEFDDEEFESMCNGAEKSYSAYFDKDVYDEDNIVNHLVDNRGFKLAKYQSEIFIG